jgi:hypothetical protein
MKEAQLQPIADDEFMHIISPIKIRKYSMIFFLA